MCPAILLPIQNVHPNPPDQPGSRHGIFNTHNFSPVIVSIVYYRVSFIVNQSNNVILHVADVHADPALVGNGDLIPGKVTAVDFYIAEPYKIS